jgi:predicted amidohydrolase/molybdopterin-guanine dinucleotide biosynthesis protein A
MSDAAQETTATTAAVILAGGEARRLGGVDKTRLPIAGASTLLRILRTVPAQQRIVVGPAGEDGTQLEAEQGARFVCEDPPGSGPAAAVARGVAAVAESGAETVLLLGGDMPLLRTETLDELVRRQRETGAVAALTAEDGHVQFLCAAWPLARLQAALAAIQHPGGGWADLSLRRLYAQLGEHELVTVPASGAEATDLDTPEALAAVRAAAGPRIALAQIIASPDFAETEQIVRRAVAEAADAGAHLVLLPEATLTPFGTDLRRAADAHHEDFEQLLAQLAHEHRIVVAAGSFTPADGQRVHNTVIVRGPGPDGTKIRTDYRKIHLFDAYGARESDTVSPGDRLASIDLAGTRLGIATCYDVRFPEQFVELARRGAQAILLPLAWGDGPGKSEQLRILLQARALDSTTVILAADQAPPADRHVGKAPRGIGQSAVIGPLGQLRQELGREEGMLLVDLDLAEIAAARRALPVLEHGSPGS